MEGRQFQLYGLEICNFKCLTDCPIPPGRYADTDCIWDDPAIGMFDLIVYPEFFDWRFEQVFGNYDGFLEITPDMMDEYFKEPEDKTQTRCPRCLSIDVVFLDYYRDFLCNSCGYLVSLIDYPANIGR